jgi:hypothetical protein
MPENELDEIDKFSAEHGYTRSGQAKKAKVDALRRSIGGGG